MENIYYSPEKFGLKELGEVDTGGSYEFNKFVAWSRPDDGAVFWSTDSGCSCPSPFEDLESVDSLERVRDVAEFARVARAWVRDASDASASDRDAMELIIRRVQRRMKTKAVAA
ncbi:DUF7574 domain-containing protein [Streptomyces sp. NBC_00239]|uniref:DUF7574 domain-containing protein n=1 Tax=Streptomyces sp. NBC_00239 TaxID=2903640 RepID=UPI002E2834A7|nr:hypothetical protein [Streptomyces sp. NBC_00239]